jgi:hypothetical protein
VDKIHSRSKDTKEHSKTSRGSQGLSQKEDFKSQIALGEALRNRGTLDGVYGCAVAINEPKAVWDTAKRAWRASEGSNLVKGATNWENVEAFGVPYWAKDMEITAKIGSHTFYKEKK